MTGHVDPAAVDTAAVAAALCAAGGLLVPWLLRRMPEPVLAEDDDGPYVPYAEIAATPRLALRSALAAGLVGAVLGLAQGWAWPLLFLLPLVPAGVALAVADWRTHLLPRQLILGAHAATVVLVAVCWVVERDDDAVLRAAIATVAVRSAFWLLWWVRSAGMGFGDVRLSALIGTAVGYIGWSELLVGLWLGWVAFTVPGLVRAVATRDRAALRAPAPLGPFLLAGAVAGIAVGGLTGWSLGSR